MGIVFCGLGVYVLFFFPQEYTIPERSRVMFGVVLLLYGVYRIASLKIKQRQENEER
ncbi:MAG: hypothetical protein H3C35_04025 [Bacteroidetes bacterium]|nr:hypothetical protein [Bacteroidota bacterium]